MTIMQSMAAPIVQIQKFLLLLQGKGVFFGLFHCVIADLKNIAKDRGAAASTVGDHSQPDPTEIAKKLPVPEGVDEASFQAKAKEIWSMLDDMASNDPKVSLLFWYILFRLWETLLTSFTFSSSFGRDIGNSSTSR